MCSTGRIKAHRSGISRKDYKSAVRVATSSPTPPVIAESHLSAVRTRSGRLLLGVQQPPGAVAEDVGVRVGDGGEHPLGHRGGFGAQVGVDAGDDDVEAAEQLVGLVEAAVEVDVPLDAGEDPGGTGWTAPHPSG